MLVTSTRTRIVIAGSGTVAVPTGAIAMRVAVIGAGGGSVANTGGGSGGGCAASKIVGADTVSYTIGSSLANNNGGDSIASFGSYTLTGGGGTSGSTITGGIGSGGDYNYNGGNGGSFGTTGGTGGGAAGPMGYGGNGLPVYASGSSAGSSGQWNLTNGWGVGGGRGGSYSTANEGTLHGGAGAGAASGSASAGWVTGTGLSYPGGSADAQSVPTFGKAAISGFRANYSAYLPDVGGEMGGGGACTNASIPGGVGGLVIEWFYEE